MKALVLTLALLCSGPLWAEDIILPPDDFLAGAFDGQPPQAQMLWLTGELKQRVTEVLGHPPRGLRVRYWRQANRSAWILEAIGKESPITAGFVVEDGQLSQAEVLIYRESRGGEIRFRSFLQQFPGMALQGAELNRHVDNITSATLSVNAMKRMARMALLLDQHSS